MNFKVNFKPYPSASYFTFQEHQRTFDAKIHKHLDEYFSETKKHLVSLFNISPEYRFEVYEKSKLENLLSQKEKVIVKDDPASGFDFIMEGKPVKNKNTLLDLSFSFPQVEHDFTIYDTILVDPEASLGIPIGYVFVFSKMKFSDVKNANEDNKNVEFVRDIFILHRVLLDYVEKGKEMLLRESNYKAAVLNQMIESSIYLKFFTDTKYRSKTMFAAECDGRFLEEIGKMGFEAATQRVDQKFLITIANYPTHSKELVEMFSDRIAEL